MYLLPWYYCHWPETQSWWFFDYDCPHYQWNWHWHFLLAAPLCRDPQFYDHPPAEDMVGSPSAKEVQGDVAVVGRKDDEDLLLLLRDDGGGDDGGDVVARVAAGQDDHD